jgi:hypothetical protein
VSFGPIAQREFEQAWAEDFERRHGFAPFSESQPERLLSAEEHEFARTVGLTAEELRLELDEFARRHGLSPEEVL